VYGVLRIIFGHKRDVVTVEWRQLLIDELNDMYSSPNIVRLIKSRRMKWAAHIAHVWRRGEMYVGFWWGNLGGKRPLGRPRLRWEDNINMDLYEVGRGGMDWIDLAQDRDRWRAHVSAVMNLRVP